MDEMKTTEPALDLEALTHWVEKQYAQQRERASACSLSFCPEILCKTAFPV
jgi:hypothetical protein